jgi:hypothetical protein
MATRRNDEASAGLRNKWKKRASKSRALPLFVVGCAVVFLLLAGASVVGVLWALGVFAKTPGGDAAQPNIDRSEKPHARIVGQWEAAPPEVPGATMMLDLKADGNLSLNSTNKGNSATENGTWKVLSETADRFTIRLQFSGRPNPAEWDVELINNNEMRVNFLTSKSTPVTYKRRR